MNVSAIDCFFIAFLLLVQGYDTCSRTLAFTACSWNGHNRKDNMGWVLRIVVNGIGGYDLGPVFAQWTSGIGVHVKTGKIAARYVETDTVPRFEQIGSWIENDVQRVNLAGLHQLGLLE